MSPLHLTPSIHAVTLAGGSAFGLEAAHGVRRFLEQKGVGFETGAARVPLVPAAIIYDLGIGSASVRPTRELGEVAAALTDIDANGESETDVDLTFSELIGDEHAINAHESAENITAYVACGDIVG